MVGVGMREEDGIDMVESDRQRLHAQLSRRIDQQHATLMPHNGRGPASLVPRVGRAADVTGASDYGNAAGRAGAEKG
jgi:hypothetical protein